MKTKLKLILVLCTILLTFIVSAFTYWLGGYNFDSRGEGVQS